MKNTYKKQAALWLAVAIKLGFSLYVGGVFAGDSGVGKFEAEQSEEVVGSLAYDYDPVTVLDFAKWSNLSLAKAEDKAKAEPYLLQKYEIDSFGGFNPYTCELCDVKEFAELFDGRFTEDQSWKWFKYRREDLGLCFDDEKFNERTQKCELIEELSK